MPFVLDASVSGVWAFADKSSALADAVEERMKSDSALAPYIWWYEIRNLLLIGERRSRLTPADTAVFLNLLSSLPIQIDKIDDEQGILRLARNFRLSFYDAAYLGLALHHDVPLATLDKDLATAAVRAGIPLLL